MSSHPSFKSTIALISTPWLIRTTLAIQEAVLPTSNEKTTVEQKVVVKKVTGEVSGKMTNRPTLPLLRLSKKDSMADHAGSDSLSFMYAKLLPRLVRPYASAPQKLQTIQNVIAIATNIFISFLYSLLFLSLPLTLSPHLSFPLSLFHSLYLSLVLYLALALPLSPPPFQLSNLLALSSSVSLTLFTSLSLSL